MTVLQRLLRRSTTPGSGGAGDAAPSTDVGGVNRVLVPASSPSTCGAVDRVTGARCTEVGWHADHRDATDLTIVTWPR